MDELAESLATSFNVSSDPNTTDAPHPRFSQYKQKSSGSDQEARRKSILEDQKRFVNFRASIITQNILTDMTETMLGSTMQSLARLTGDPWVASLNPSSATLFSGRLIYHFYGYTPPSAD